MTDSQLLTTRQAGERLGITSKRVIALIQAGRLPAEKFGNAWMIKAADLRLVEDRRVGNPNWRKKGGETDR